MRRLHVLTMMRSGHNAFVNWLAAHYRAAGFVTDVISPVTLTLYGPMSGEPPTCDVQILAWCEQMPVQFRRAVDGSVPAGDEVLILVRDPANLFASRIEWEKRVNTPLAEDHQAVVHDMELAVWQAQYGWAQDQSSGMVSFNRWVEDVDYRRELVESRGVAFTDAGRDAVSASGGGSSFDALQFDGRARDMAVNDRWRRYVEHSEWRRLMGLIEDLPAIMRRFGVMDFPHVPRSQKAVRKRPVTRPMFDEASFEGFDPATERRGCCDPPV